MKRLCSLLGCILLAIISLIELGYSLFTYSLFLASFRPCNPNQFDIICDSVWSPTSILLAFTPLIFASLLIISLASIYIISRRQLGRRLSVLLIIAASLQTLLWAAIGLGQPILIIIHNLGFYLAARGEIAPIYTDTISWQLVIGFSGALISLILLVLGLRLRQPSFAQ